MYVCSHLWHSRRAGGQQTAAPSGIKGLIIMHHQRSFEHRRRRVAAAAAAGARTQAIINKPCSPFNIYYDGKIGLIL